MNIRSRKNARKTELICLGTVILLAGMLFRYTRIYHYFFLSDPSYQVGSYAEASNACTPENMILPQEEILLENSEYWLYASESWRWSKPAGYCISRFSYDKTKLTYSVSCHSDRYAEDNTTNDWEAVNYNSVQVLQNSGVSKENQSVSYFDGRFMIGDCCYEVSVSADVLEQNNVVEYGNLIVHSMLDQV